MRRFRLRRFPVLYWIVSFSLAIATASVVGGFLAEAEARARRWGALTEVPVAARSLDAGEVVTSDHVVRRRMPRALLPASGVVGEPVGRVATMRIVPGEVLVQAKLAPWGLDGLAALLPSGTRALAVPRGDAMPPLRRGDRVDVLATLGAESGQGPPTFAVAVDALVLDATTEAVTVAVRAKEAPRVAFALAQGVVTLALSG